VEGIPVTIDVECPICHGEAIADNRQVFSGWDCSCPHCGHKWNPADNDPKEELTEEEEAMKREFFKGDGK
jgi:ssDNA-binding Zn-finger/Zn-ribbon topoisomerase 1